MVPRSHFVMDCLLDIELNKHMKKWMTIAAPMAATYVHAHLYFVFEGISHFNPFQPIFFFEIMHLFHEKSVFFVRCSRNVHIKRDPHGFLSFFLAKTPCHDEDGKTHCNLAGRRPIQWFRLASGKQIFESIQVLRFAEDS